MVEWLMTTWLLGASVLVFCVLALADGRRGIGYGVIIVFFTIATVVLYEKRRHDSKSNDQS